MLFSRKFLLYFFMAVFSYNALASDLKTVIETKEYGSCQTNNLSFSAMRFYKIPLYQKYEDYDLYLRIILFFNLDGSVSIRSTTQALISCQTTSTGEVCSFGPVKDDWAKTKYTADDMIHIPHLGEIVYRDPSDINRGFFIKFASDFSYEHLRNKEFQGGMVLTNFNQFGENTINICKN